jgi:hypothetical protein
MMISTFYESYANPQNSIVIQNQLSRFMSDDSDANFNETLRKDLILRVQKNQDLLESLFELVLRPTKKESFIQEKPSINATQNHSNIVNLANLAVEEGIRKWPLQF